MKKKLFSFTIVELNGENEYSHEHLCYADNYDEAVGLANEYARTFYYDESVQRKEGAGEEFPTYDFPTFEFFGCSICVVVEIVSQTTKKRWTEERFRFAMVN